MIGFRASKFVLRTRIRARGFFEPQAPAGPYGPLGFPRAFGAAGARSRLRVAGRSPNHSQIFTGVRWLGPRPADRKAKGRPQVPRSEAEGSAPRTRARMGVRKTKPYA
ncbi:hypothetical protein GCM10009127_00740 [Alteraurantiacibacter aestuarii]